MFKSINLKKLIRCIALPVAVGAASALFTRGNMEVYKNINQPPLAPPSWLFPVVWTILFILMGISAYIISQSGAVDKSSALTVYGIQLAVNFFWSIIFFNMQAYTFAFVWLMFLWVLIIILIIKFYTINKTAAYLQIPYLLWVTFAAYLNLAIAILN